ncbi:MAG TPA: hypothetical protein VFU36_13690 [Jatrophihabitans sp.]|nr:hypothetical protein [Jatrophihabitans sp.]
MNLDRHILQILASAPAGTRPITIGDFARQFGISATLVLPTARRLVDDGLAIPAMVNVHGVPTLRGLLPLATPDGGR